MNTDDDEMLPQARIFSRRDVDIPIFSLEQYQKFLAEAESSQEEEPEMEEIPKTGKQKKAQKTVKAKAPEKNQKGKKAAGRQTRSMTKTKPASNKKTTVVTEKTAEQLEEEKLLSQLPAASRRKLGRAKASRNRDLKKIDGIMEVLNHVNDEVEEVVDFDTSFEDETVLKVCYMSKYYKITCRDGEKFSSIYQKTADILNLKTLDILLCYKERTILSDDTPKSLGLQMFDVIDCVPYIEIGNKNQDPNKLLLKIQSSDLRKKMEFYIFKVDKLQDVMEKYSKIRNVPLENMCFEFDGEKISGTETPDDLDMESGSCIDVKVRNVAGKSPVKGKRIKATTNYVPVQSHEMLTVVEINDSDEMSDDSDSVCVL